jgi:hypothetical protein
MIDVLNIRWNGPSLEFFDKTNGNVVAKFQLFSAADNLIATGTNRATALALSASTIINRLTSVVSGTGVILPTSLAGFRIIVINAGSNPVTVYAAGGETIDGTAGATGYSLANGKTCEFLCASSGAWHKKLSA